MLLGHLARFGSFWTQSELLCTQGLTYLLQTYGNARSALANEIAERTGVETDNSLTWYAEAMQQDRGRPDLEARSANDVPVVKIEAKLGAELSAEQLKSYEADLRRSGRETALLVLVPEGRSTEAAQVTGSALGLLGSSPWPVTKDRPCGV